MIKRKEMAKKHIELINYLCEQKTNLEMLNQKNRKGNNNQERNFMSFYIKQETHY